MEIDLRVPDDYCQGAEEHVQPLEYEDWEDDQPSATVAYRCSQTRIRGRGKA
jgi:hypothetical protein